MDPLTLIVYSLLWATHFDRQVFLFNQLIADFSNVNLVFISSRVFAGFISVLFLFYWLFASLAPFTAINVPLLRHSRSVLNHRRHLHLLKAWHRNAFNKKTLLTDVSPVLSPNIFTHFLHSLRHPGHIALVFDALLKSSAVAGFIVMVAIAVKEEVLTTAPFLYVLFPLVIWWVLSDGSSPIWPVPALFNPIFTYPRNQFFSFLERAYIIGCSDTGFLYSQFDRYFAQSPAHSNIVELKDTDFPDPAYSLHQNVRRGGIPLSFTPISPVKRTNWYSLYTPSFSHPSQALYGIKSNSMISLDANYHKGNMFIPIYSHAAVGTLIIHVAHLEKIDWLISCLHEVTEESPVPIRAIVPRGYLYLAFSRFLSSTRITLFPTVEGHERVILLSSITAIIAESVLQIFRSTIRPGMGESLLKMDTNIAIWENGNGEKRILKTNTRGALVLSREEECPQGRSAIASA